MRDSIKKLTGADILTDLTIMQYEIIKAVDHNDYPYLVDLGGLDQEVNLGFKFTN